jgi:tRNA uridine 5-carbamoylmethylation protein Kti12
MQKIIILKGLPACGKSTWSRNLQNEHPGKYKRVNKDELRAMLDNSYHGKQTEELILKIRDFIILQSISDGYDVLVDDTNLNPVHEKHIRGLVQNITEFEIEIKDFTDVDLETCIERDEARTDRVGEDVIRGMYNKYLKK